MGERGRQAELFTLVIGGTTLWADGEVASLTAGQTHVFQRSRPRSGTGSHAVDLGFKRPKAPYTCIRGFVLDSANFDYHPKRGTIFVTPKACI